MNAVVSATVDPRHAELRHALFEACEQLEGWIAWKCPRKYKAEHMANLARLRAVGGFPPPVQQAATKVVDIEVLVWIDPADPKRPDPESEVLCHFKSMGLVMAAWDDDIKWWRDCHGLTINGGDLVGWAEPRGVLE